MKKASSLQTEAYVVKATTDFAKRHGIPFIRLTFRNGVQAGWPDHLFLIPGGKPTLIEFKATGKKPSKLQAHKIKQLKDLGYDVQVHDNKDSACRALAQAMGTDTLHGKSR